MISIFRWGCFCGSTACFLLMATLWPLFINFYTTAQVLPYVWIGNFCFALFVLRFILGFCSMIVVKKAQEKCARISIYVYLLLEVLSAGIMVCVKAKDYGLGWTSGLDPVGIFPRPIIAIVMVCLLFLITECGLKLALYKSRMREFVHGQKVSC